MRSLPLTKGKVCLVDNEYFEYLNQWKWRSEIHGTNEYVVRLERGKTHKTRKVIYIHRVIMNTPEGLFTDHIDGNGLNNQRINLRIVTTAQNVKNRRINRNNTSGYKGVTWCKKKNKYLSQIMINNKQKNLGYFLNQLEAAKAYNAAAIKYHGEFAKLNKI